MDGGILTVRPKGRWSIFCVYLTIPAVNLKKHPNHALLLSIVCCTIGRILNLSGLISVCMNDKRAGQVMDVTVTG